MEGQELGRQLIGHDEEDVWFCVSHARPYMLHRET
jgi:hypothetical protein